jgi:hypothetical protein
MSTSIDLAVGASNQPNNSPNGREPLSDGERTKKRSRYSSRRQFLGQAGGATAAVLAVTAIGLEPLTGSNRSTARAIEISPFTGNNPDRTDRANQAEEIRVDAANAEQALGQPVHPTNGDEELYPNRIGNFHKTLPHNSIGEVDQAAYNQYRRISKSIGRLSLQH